MQEKLLLGNRYTLDINVVAIYLVENHPGNRYVTEVLDFGIRNKVEFILFDFLPLRVFWILTSKWGIRKDDAKDAIISFMDLPNVKLVSIGKDDIKEAFKIAKLVNHDVFDTIYCVIAKKNNCAGIITTDRDFEKICGELGLEYINPVPDTILKKFHKYK